MYIAGDYVQVKNKKGYEGSLGKILGWRPLFEIELIHLKRIIYCSENEIVKLSDEQVKKIFLPKIQKEYIKIVEKFNKVKKYVNQVKETYTKLKEFNEKYPFNKLSEVIEDLTPDDLFLELSNQMGSFFHWIVYELEGLGSLNLYPRVYKEVSRNLERFKDLLNIAVDPSLRLVDKIDAPWHKIKGMGGDTHLAKKIIC